MRLFVEKGSRNNPSPPDQSPDMGFFIVGLVLAGATAIPLKWELDSLANIFGLSEHSASPLAGWILHVQTALSQTSAEFPFLYYGTDWLAFGHFAIAIAFVGALRDPVRNCWLYTFGMIACALIIPYALVFGGCADSALVAIG